ncbi:MAG: hypothetical protein Q4C45_04635, partial [Oscillospiraceae bacterium]|nr:hypothetical protein [Oscillospiraceae bacterium]
MKHPGFCFFLSCRGPRCFLQFFAPKTLQAPDRLAIINLHMYMDIWKVGAFVAKTIAIVNQ